jgi:hypothetical protein
MNKLILCLIFCSFSFIFSSGIPNRNNMNPSTSHNLRALTGVSWEDSTTRKYTLAADDSDSKYLGNPSLADSISMEYWVCFLFLIFKQFSSGSGEMTFYLGKSNGGAAFNSINNDKKISLSLMVRFNNSIFRSDVE